MEVRSDEASHVHGLWHLDFHKSKPRVVDNNGEWNTPIALCIALHIFNEMNEVARLFRGTPSLYVSKAFVI